jgi:hypothetical protein
MSDAETVRAYLIECGVRKDLINSIVDDMAPVELRLRASEIAREKKPEDTEVERAMAEVMSKRPPVIRGKGRIAKARANLKRRSKLPTGRPRGRPRKHST